MKLFFDLDGTLLDARPRLYQLFQKLVPSSKLSFDAYWELKRNKIGHSEILKTQFFYTEKALMLFETAWMEAIEKPEWLALDKPFGGVTEYLIELKEKDELYLITARQYETKVMEQVLQYGWDEIFKKIFVTGQKKEKYELIKNSMVLSSEDWFIGDTGKDIETGKKLGLKTAAVLTGFLSKEKLEEYKPDLIVENIFELKF